MSKYTRQLDRELAAMCGDPPPKQPVKEFFRDIRAFGMRDALCLFCVAHVLGEVIPAHIAALFGG